MFEYEVEMVNSDTARGAGYVMATRRIVAPSIHEAEEHVTRGWRASGLWPILGWYPRAIYIREVPRG